MPWWVLLIILFVTGFFTDVLTVWVYAEEDRAKGVPDDQRRGVSIFPTLLVLPVCSVVLAKIFDRVADPWGTIVILCLHAALLALHAVAAVALTIWYRWKTK